jgi:hypothetical protein
MVVERKLEKAARDSLCRCGWPRRYVATLVMQFGPRTQLRLLPLCELHGAAFAVHWNMELPA